MRRYVMIASGQQSVLSSARDPQTGHHLGKRHHFTIVPPPLPEGAARRSPLNIRMVCHGMDLFVWVALLHMCSVKRNS